MVLVGGVDVSALVERRGQRLVYRPTVAPRPAGATEIIVYQKRGADWAELRRVTVKVLTTAGFTRIAFTPTTTLGNKGQLSEGRSEGTPAPERSTFQDFVLNGSLTTTHEAPRFTIESSSNYMGVSRREEAEGDRNAVMWRWSSLLADPDHARFCVSCVVRSSQYRFGFVRYSVCFD